MCASIILSFNANCDLVKSVDGDIYSCLKMVKKWSFYDEQKTVLKSIHKFTRCTLFEKIKNNFIRTTSLDYWLDVRPYEQISKMFSAYRSLFLSDHFNINNDTTPLNKTTISVEIKTTEPQIQIYLFLCKKKAWSRTCWPQINFCCYYKTILGCFQRVCVCSTKADVGFIFSRRLTHYGTRFFVKTVL